MKNAFFYLRLFTGTMLVAVGIYLIITVGGNPVMQNSTFPLSGNLIGVLFIAYGAFRFFKAYTSYQAIQRSEAHQAMVDAKAAELEDTLRKDAQ